MKYSTYLFIAIFHLIPLSAQPATQPAPEKVLILQFVPVDSSQKNESISRGVQQTMQADFAKCKNVQPIIPDTKIDSPVAAYGTAETVQLARGQHAKFVIHGSYQIVETELRIVGVVVDADSGQTVGGLKSTGNLRDLFDMEDSLSHQAQRLISPRVAWASRPCVLLNAEHGQDARATAEESIPYRNFYAWNYGDPAVVRSRQTLQTRLDYVDPCYGFYGGYFSSSYFGYGSFYGGRRLGYYP